jgi:predicted DCC family thiol-disulfide oxidoreductase YuxK
LIKARAALYVLSGLGGVWMLFRPLQILPSSLLNLGYDLVARHRYQIFGKSESCAMPTPEQRSRFLDLAPRPQAPGGSS